MSKTTNNIRVGTHFLNLNWSAAYTYGVTKDLSNGIRNSFQSNFEVNPAIVPNSPQLAYSNFDLRDRIVATLGSTLVWNPMNATSLSFFYAGQSGSPYSVVYASGGNPFNNAANANLPYIPKDQNDIKLIDNGSYTAAQQWADLNALISGDKYLSTRRGQKSVALYRHCDELFRIAEGDTAFSQCIPPPGQKSQLVIQVAGERQVILSITRAQRSTSSEDQPEAVLVFRDVSEEVTIHRLLGYFIANIAQEFRTPLSALAASIELLMDQAPDFSTEEVDELLKSLHLGVLSLQTLVDNLLESASIEAGHFRVSPRPYDLDKIIQEVITTMHPLIDKYGQCLILEANEPLPVVMADPRRIVQVLVNLISNAIRYGPEMGEVTLSVSVHKDQVTVQVADRGPGISGEQRELLFRRFEYPAAAGTQSKVGAGHPRADHAGNTLSG